MRLLFIRHGDPDYANDTLTEKGRREAALLAGSASSLNLGDCYVSPLGRARETAAPSLEAIGRTAPVLDWLQEFPAQLDVNALPELQAAYPDTRTANGRFCPRIVWDMLPTSWADSPEYADPVGWRFSAVARHSDIVTVYDRVAAGLDELLARYGYVRRGNLYHTEQGNQQTVTFFCHFGVTCVLLSHLWNVSPFILWHSLALAPTSVTELVTEERQKGNAYFRALRLGDQSHLTAAGETASFSARFCETYERKDQRH